MFELKRNEIFRGKRNFNQVYSHGRSFADKNMVIYVLSDETVNGQVGFAAGKKLGCAVIRNRVKRLLREAYRLNKKNIRRDCAIILVGRKNLIKAKCDVAEKSFRTLCKRANILKDVDTLEQ